ncbi:hypothetical protein ACQUSR_13330 [Streptomyces sp. P1-3]|uniref:hypothetical protein n=1 Tax=Streptomyces sp. P1-3 TaxID=3421658 RepID=UPI003D35F903
MRSTRTSVRLAAVAGGIVLTVGLTACGSEDGGEKGSGGGGTAKGGSVLAALRLASERTGEQHSAKVDGTTAVGPATSVMKGSMDWTDGMRANMIITQRGGQIDSSPLAGKPLEARYTPDAMYMNLGDDFAAAPESGGKHWVKYDYATLTKQAGAAGKFFKDQMRNTDPARAVQLLVATGKVRSVGEERVRGVTATHYTGTVKVADLAGMQSEELTGQDLEDLQDQLEQAGMETETIDLWIDGDDLLVKKREQAQGSDGAYDATVYYSDYGTAVAVEEPPASDTLGFEDMLPQQS